MPVLTFIDGHSETYGLQTTSDHLDTLDHVANIIIPNEKTPVPVMIGQRMNVSADWEETPTHDFEQRLAGAVVLRAPSDAVRALYEQLLQRQEFEKICESIINPKRTPVKTSQAPPWKPYALENQIMTPFIWGGSKK